MTRPTASGALAIEPLAARPRATVSLPGSKSITNRALVCAALAAGDTRIEGALLADDTKAMAEAVAVLGADVTADPDSDSFEVRGLDGSPRPVPGAVIDARMSGTTGRFLVPVAATASTPVTVDGHPQLRARPFGGVIEAVGRLGAHIETAGGGTGLPLRVRGPMGSGPASVRVDRSSQFLSGLMLAGPVVPGGLSLSFDTVPVSRPYVEMTAAVMRSFGAEVQLDSDGVRVAGGGYTSPGRYRIEPDASAASYFWAAAAVTGGTVGVAGLDENSIQGDVAFASALAAMGASVGHGPVGEITVIGGPLHGTDVDLGDLSDTAPTMAVAAALASGPTTVRGIGFIRAKESDRIAGPVAELRRCGGRRPGAARWFHCGARPRVPSDRSPDPHLRRPSHGHGVRGSGPGRARRGDREPRMRGQDLSGILRQTGRTPPPDRVSTPFGGPDSAL